MQRFNSTEPVRWSEILNRRYASSVVLVCLGVWLHAADGLVVATMLPSMLPEIGGEAYVAWTVALYEIGSIVAGAASGLLARRLGIRKPMIFAAALFAFGCLVAAFAPNMAVFLICRLLQGLGGGMLAAVSFVAVAVLFPPRLVVRALAAISALWGTSAFLGPLAGGMFVTWATWRLGFVFFGAQALALSLWILFGARIHEKLAGTGLHSRFPVARLMLLSAGVMCVAYAGLEIIPLRMGACLAGGLCAIALFVWIDSRRGGDRLLPGNILNLRQPANAALLLILMLHCGTSGMITYGPILLITIHGATPIAAGFVLACISIAWTLSAIAVSGAAEHRDSTFIALGTVLVAVSVCGLLYSVSYGPVWLIFVFAAFEGLGQGASRAFIVRRAVTIVREEDRERITGAMPTVARLGYALGAAFCGLLANAAGFSLEMKADQAAAVARFIFVGSLPFALLAVAAMIALLVMSTGRLNNNADPPAN